MVTELTLENMMPGGTEPDDYMHIVMFHGATCGPCKATMPNYEEAAKNLIEKGARIKFHKLHAWETEEVRQKCQDTWGVTGVPHFKIFMNGVNVFDKLGGGDLEEINRIIQSGIDEAFKRFNIRI